MIVERVTSAFHFVGYRHLFLSHSRPVGRETFIYIWWHINHMLHVHPSIAEFAFTFFIWRYIQPKLHGQTFRPRLMFVRYFGLGRYLLFFYLFFMVSLTLYSKTLPSHFLEGYQFEFDQPKYRIYILLMIPFLFTKGIFF